MEVYTIRDIARIAGVSVTTVSRVLNHRPDVNSDTRERVQQVIRDCHFVGNTNARGLKQNAYNIGVVIRGHSNPFLNALAEALLDLADQSQDHLLTEYIDEKENEFLTALHMTQQSRLRGLIFVGSLIDERVQVIHGMDLPMVFTTVNAKNASLPRASSVSIDDRAMGRLVGDELLRLGHREIGVFGSNPVAGDSLAMRYQGFLDAFAANGLTYNPDYYRETRFSLQEGYDLTQSFLTEHPEVTALFTMSDNLALGAMRAIRDMGKSIPEDVSVFGFDGIDMGRFTIPRLTTVEQPVEEIARHSFRLLQEMIHGQAEPCHLVVNASLQIRESVAPPKET